MEKITKPLIFFYSQCPHMFLTLPSQVLHMFLRTARSFYDSLWYLHTYILTYLHTYVRTYVRTYVQVIFQGTHPTLKLLYQKVSQMIQVHVPNFFFRAEIQKMTKIDPKTPLSWQKIAVNQFFLKNSSS